MERTRRAPAAEEIVFGSADTRISTAISRELRAGRLRRIAPKPYTTNLKDPPESIVRRHLYRVLAQLRAANAFSEPHEGRLSMPERAIVT